MRLQQTHAGLTAGAPRLSVHDPALLDAPGPRVRALVWRTEVTSWDGDLRELVLVDATTGSVPSSRTSTSS